jgi:hypothetical protein
LSRIINVPSDSELAIDMRDIPFLKEDQKDAAEIQSREAATIRTLTDAGFKPDTVIAAVVAGNFNMLKHTGLFSVQLQPPGTDPPGTPPVVAPAANGTNSTRRAAEQVVEDLLASLPTEG